MSRLNYVGSWPRRLICQTVGHKWRATGRGRTLGLRTAYRSCGRCRANGPVYGATAERLLAVGKEVNADTPW